MSRSGTLQDALRFVDEFQRAAAPSSREKKLAAHEYVEDFKQDKGERRVGHRRENSDKDRDGRKKSKGDKDRQRRRKVVKRDEDDEEGSDEDDGDSKEKRRAERKKEDRRKHRKKKERKSTSRRVERKSEKESSRRREKRKQEQRSRRLRSPEDDSSPSEDEDSDSGSKSSESQSGNSALRAEQVAADIVMEFPEVQDDLQQLLQMVDSGQAVDISGLPNKRLISLLQELFQCLRLDRSSGGVYLLPSGSRPTLERLGPAFKSRNEPNVCMTSGKAQDYGPEFRSPPSVEREVSKSGHTFQAEGKETCVPSTGPEIQKRRVMGPAMPSAEMLEAAAKLTEAEGALRDAEAALENDPMIGPPPPAAVAEASSANDAERFEEVTRITASDVGDAYELLGLKQGVNAGDLKKRYWKLSLLVHPDKCQHPHAHQAFMALNKAFKDLQDPLKRSEIDRKADEKLAKEEYEADRRAQREAAQWRKLRGEEALPGDAQLLQGDVKDLARDEWMTALPPERQAGGPPSQQNTFFSRTEKRGRGDTSAWTDTPLEKAQRAKMQYLEAYNQAALEGPENSKLTFEMEKAAKAATVMDDYNQKKRSLSLVEKHQQNSVKGLKKKAKKEKSGQIEEKDKQWAETHPWKPWDREKDLTAGRQSMKWDDKKTSAEVLSSRFGSSGQRNFL